MNMRLNNFLVSTLCFVLLCSSTVQSAGLESLAEEAMRGSHRDKANIKRDIYRHPMQTLRFFGLQSYMTVVEIWPGRGWYSEILAPIMRDEGTLYLAGFSTMAKRTPEWRKTMQKDFLEKLAKHPDVYDRAIITELSVPEKTNIAPEESVDMVLTFRNVHNWMKGDYAEQMFQVFARVLKPGGVLGVVEHRAEPDTSIADMIESGYVTEDFVIELAEAAGFIFEARTDINANSNDIKSYPKGVWTLPPTLRFCKAIDDEADKEQCIEQYTAIGESDRMTLKFRKR